MCLSKIIMEKNASGELRPHSKWSLSYIPPKIPFYPNSIKTKRFEYLRSRIYRKWATCY